MSTTIPAKAYLSDGLYVEIDHERESIRVFASNGHTESNEVFFDYDGLKALAMFVRKTGWSKAFDQAP